MGRLGQPREAVGTSTGYDIADVLLSACQRVQAMPHLKLNHPCSQHLQLCHLLRGVACILLLHREQLNSEHVSLMIGPAATPATHLSRLTWGSSKWQGSGSRQQLTCDEQPACWPGSIMSHGHGHWCWMQAARLGWCWMQAASLGFLAHCAPAAAAPGPAEPASLPGHQYHPHCPLTPEHPAHVDVSQSASCTQE